MHVELPSYGLWTKSNLHRRSPEVLTRLAAARSYAYAHLCIRSTKKKTFWISDSNVVTGHTIKDAWYSENKKQQ